MTKVARIVSALVLVAGVSAAPASANLITNPGFETGDFTGWTQGGNTGFTFVNGMPHSGTYAAWLGPIGSHGTLSQTLTTVPGASYNISFWFALLEPPTPNFFSLIWNGSTSFSFTNFPTAFPYAQLVFTAPATSTSTVITFEFQQNPSWWLLDDVEVNAAIPEPGTLLLLGSGLTGLAMRRRRRKQA